MTDQDVTECLGAGGDPEDDLTNRYHRDFDPRLNAEQAMTT